MATLVVFLNFSVLVVQYTKKQAVFECCSPIYHHHLSSRLYFSHINRPEDKITLSLIHCQ